MVKSGRYSFFVFGSNGTPKCTLVTNKMAAGELLAMGGGGVLVCSQFFARPPGNDSDTRYVSSLVSPSVSGQCSDLVVPGLYYCVRPMGRPGLSRGRERSS